MSGAIATGLQSMMWKKGNRKKAVVLRQPFALSMIVSTNLNPFSQKFEWQAHKR